MKAGREDVRQHRQVEHLLHRLFAVRELEQVPIGVGDHHVLSLASDPTAHVHVTVGRAGPVGIGVQANAGVALLAVGAPSACDVERHRAEVSLLDELDIWPGLDHLAGDLVAEDQSGGRRRTTSDHVLIRTADVRRNDPQDRSMTGLASDVVRMNAGSVLELELREVDVMNLDLARLDVGDAPVIGHDLAPRLERRDAGLGDLWSCSTDPPLTPIAPTTASPDVSGIPPAKMIRRPWFEAWMPNRGWLG